MPAKSEKLDTSDGTGGLGERLPVLLPGLPKESLIHSKPSGIGIYGELKQTDQVQTSILIFHCGQGSEEFEDMARMGEDLPDVIAGDIRPKPTDMGMNGILLGRQEAKYMINKFWH